MGFATFMILSTKLIIAVVPKIDSLRPPQKKFLENHVRLHPNKFK
jgi:hypothetical protein